MRSAAAERAIGGVVGAPLISASSDVHTLPIPSLLRADNLPDSLGAYIQVFGRNSRGHQRISRIFKTREHPHIWLLPDLK